MTPDPAPPPIVLAVRPIPWLLVAAAAIALAVLLVAVVGGVIDHGTQFAFDRAILLWARGGSAGAGGLRSPCGAVTNRGDGSCWPLRAALRQRGGARGKHARAAGTA